MVILQKDVGAQRNLVSRCLDYLNLCTSILILSSNGNHFQVYE